MTFPELDISGISLILGKSELDSKQQDNESQETAQETETTNMLH